MQISMISDERKKQLLFPYPVVREEQNKLLLLTDAVIKNKKNLIVHAPTGLGKTAATLAPALAQAIENDLTVLFLTSRHTQHKIAIETLKEIRDKYNISTTSVSIIGKKWMCLQPSVGSLYSSEFADYCKKLREDKKCQFYTNSRKNMTKFTIAGSNLLKKLEKIAPLSTEQVIEHSHEEKMCPYEISIGLARKAKVIITDYYYLFHPSIGNNFLTKISKELDKLIVIVDEAHNLPNRLKDLASEYLTTVTIKRAVREAKKYGYDNIVEMLNELLNLIEKLAKDMKVNDERIVKREEFEKPLHDSYDYDQITVDFSYIGDEIRELQKQSYIGAIARFLEAWQGQEEGFVRILALKQGLREPYITLSYRCLDPSVISQNIVNNTRSTIMMSGTLLPTSMYKEVLGVHNCQEVVFKDPFPKKNRLNLIVPKTTTKYSKRTVEQYKDISDNLSKMINSIPGNSAVFFPSYYLRDQVIKYLVTNKTTFIEHPNMTKSEKQDLLKKFKSYKDTGAVLLAVASGSFGEGIDLPGDLLKAVIVVGLPLSQPDLEIKSLIKYYDKKFNKGWDYGYLFPAFNKSLQNAGRCIRSGTDKGLIVFLDERYIWNNYKRCFPEDWDLVINTNHIQLIEDFFNN